MTAKIKLSSIANQPESLRVMTALLYDDVRILEQWENEERVVIIWTRSSDWLVDYQADRLSSALIPSYDLWPGMVFLAQEMGLYVPCIEQEA